MNRMVACWVGLLLLIPLSGWAQEEECRLQIEDLKPVIQRFNPYFANHKWSQENRMELARIGDHRLLMITQDGCLRHHTVFTLVLDQAAIESRPGFWEEEAIELLRKVYFERPVYQEFETEFSEAFAQKLDAYGLGERFNFPIGTRNFICEILYDPSRGARIVIEMVEYLFKQPTVAPGSPAPSEQDDGWIGHEEH